MENLRLPSNRLEEMILAYCRIDLSFFLKIKTYLDTSKSKNKNYFNDEKNQKIFNLLCRFFDRFEKFPKKETMLSFIEKLKEDKEIKFLLSTIINKVYEQSAENIDPEFIEEETKSFIKEAKAYEAILYAQIDIENKNFSNMVNRIEDAARITFDKDFGLSIKDVDESLERIRRLDKEAKISTGYPNLDQMMDGGMHPKELTVFSAIPGGYKTGFLGNIAINCFFNGYKVLVYTFETSSERLAMRYFQNIANMTKGEIILNEEGLRKKIQNLPKDSTGNLIIKEYNSNAICANEIMAHMNDLRLYEQFEPAIVFLDYILIMQTNDKSLSSKDSYKYYKTVSEEIRNISKSLYIPVVSACQINRQGMSDRGGSKALVTAKDIAESRGIYDTADVFITLSQTASDKKKGNIYLYFDKNRNERSGIRISYQIDYEHHRIKEGGIL